MAKPQDSKQSRRRGKKYRKRNDPMTLISFYVPKQLIEEVDESAAEEHTNRSEFMRQAIMWYLKPSGKKLAMARPEVIYQTVKRRKDRASYKKWLKDIGPLNKLDYH
jgi:hypothetical protein